LKITKSFTVFGFALCLVFFACARRQVFYYSNPEGYTCFTKLAATEPEIRKALLTLYATHPENRIDFNYILAAGLINPNITEPAKGNPAKIDSIERGYFYSWHLKEGNARGERWQLKTSDGKIGYGLTLEFCDTTGRTNCDLCLVGQLRKADMDGTRKGSLEFSKREKEQFMAYLKQDLLEKLAKIIEEERKQKYNFNGYHQLINRDK
jgi:hypothetical protein